MIPVSALKQPNGPHSLTGLYCDAARVHWSLASMLQRVAVEENVDVSVAPLKRISRVCEKLCLESGGGSVGT